MTSRGRARGGARRVARRAVTACRDGVRGPVARRDHLIVFRHGPGETLIADKTIYSSRCFKAGILVMSLSDSLDGHGYYVIAGSPIMSSQLSGVAAKVLRRQVERSALDLVRMYLGWLRESLAVPAVGH